MGDVEERLKSILKEEGSDCQSAGNCTRVFSYLFTECHGTNVFGRCGEMFAFASVLSIKFDFGASFWSILSLSQ